MKALATAVPLALAPAEVGADFLQIKTYGVDGCGKCSTAPPFTPVAFTRPEKTELFGTNKEGELPRRCMGTVDASHPCGFIPPYMLEEVATTQEGSYVYTKRTCTTSFCAPETCDTPENNVTLLTRNPALDNPPVEMCKRHIDPADGAQASASYSILPATTHCPSAANPSSDCWRWSAPTP